jgi:hypothetical protein
MRSAMTSAIRGHASALSLLLVLALSTSGALAQAGGSSGGGSGGGAASSSAGSAASRGGGAAGGIGSPAARVGPGSTSGSGAGDPRSLGNQPATAASPGSRSPATLPPGGTPAPAGTTTPSGTAYPSGTPLEAARQRALQGPAGTSIPPSAAGVGADRSGTSGVGSDSATEAATPGLPDQAPPDRGTSGDPARATAGGGAPRQGAVGKTMAECEAAWDAETHMSKETWRNTCRRTLTEPHL